MFRTIYFLMVCLFFACCGQKNATKGTESSSVTAVRSTDSRTVNTPDFNADSAYAYIARQVAFGPRVPNTEAHKACAAYLASELERHGANVFIQKAVLTAYTGDKLNAQNIIGSFDPDKTRRVLLFAHWDTRPFADQDKDPANHNKPIDGADDGGSGVGVLLEIARQTGIQKPDIGVDIIFFDAEDYGSSSVANSFCLGSQYWAKNPHIPNYRAEYGILLDMVGAKGANFYKEFYSVKYASRYVEKVWTTARELGYGKFFINAKGGMIYDDHVPVNEIRRIPSIDIINLDSDNENDFGAHWHTLKDNMDIISKETLKAVGQTVLTVIFRNEK